MRDSNASQMFR